MPCSKNELNQTFEIGGGGRNPAAGEKNVSTWVKMKKMSQGRACSPQSGLSAFFLPNQSFVERLAGYTQQTGRDALIVVRSAQCFLNQGVFPYL